MAVVLIATVFFGLDFGAVLLALAALHRRRVDLDYTDLRYRNARR